MPAAIDTRPNLDLSRLAFRDSARMVVESPEGTTIFSVANIGGQHPFEVQLEQIQDRRALVPRRLFSGELHFKIWVNSLERGLDGDRPVPPLPRLPRPEQG